MTSPDQPPSYRTIAYRVDGEIARIVLDRPERNNVLTDEAFAELLDALDRMDRDDGVHLAILDATGPNFCAGFDLADEDSDHVRTDRPLDRHLQFMRNTRNDFTTVFDTRKPVVAKVRGYCLAGGCYLQMLCDVTIAAEDAIFGHPAMVTGGISAMPLLWKTRQGNAVTAGAASMKGRRGWAEGAPVRSELASKCRTGYGALWNWYVGLRKAKELLLTGKLIDGVEAERIGLVNLAVPEEKLDEEVEQLARQMLTVPRDCLVLTKEALNTTADVMGLAASFRTQGHLTTLARFGSEMRIDLDTLRQINREKIRGLRARYRKK